MTYLAHFVRGWLVLLTGVVMVSLLSACGGSDEQAPLLAAPPTRTPAPATTTREPDDPLANLTIVSLRDDVVAYLEQAPDVSALDWPVLFDQLVFDPHPECFSDAFYTGADPLELIEFNLVSSGLDIWRTSVDSFPEDALRKTIAATLARAAENLPLPREFRVCLLPAPASAEPDEMNNYGLHVETLSSDLLVLSCSGSDACTANLGPSVAYAYHYAVQLDGTTLDATTMTLGERAIFNGRADDYARHLYPDARFPWHVDLSPEQESDVWGRMREFLDVNYTVYPAYRRIDLFLYGKGSDLYPDWAGMAIGMNIVRAFHDNNPFVTYAELARMPAKEVLARSGYMPG